MAKILRFEFDSLSCIRIFEHPALGKHSIKLKEIYDILAEYYEFGGRFNVMQSKIKDLRKIVGIVFIAKLQRNRNPPAFV